MGEHYDRQGQRIDVDRWIELFEQGEEYRRVAASTIGSIWVSTVWLGLDHRFFGEGPPLIFETMVFGSDDLSDDWGCVRTSTEQEAREAHQEAVEMVTSVIGKEVVDGKP